MFRFRWPGDPFLHDQKHHVEKWRCSASFISEVRANGVLSVATFEYGRAFTFSYDHIIAAIGFLDFDAIYVPYIL